MSAGATTRGSPAGRAARSPAASGMPSLRWYCSRCSSRSACRCGWSRCCGRRCPSFCSAISTSACSATTPSPSTAPPPRSPRSSAAIGASCFCWASRSRSSAMSPCSGSSCRCTAGSLSSTTASSVSASCAAGRSRARRRGCEMGIGAIIIGDEIVRGKREDKHFARLIEILRARGMRLDWCQYLGDKPGLITATLRRTLASGDIVFSFGGIGATPDDHTRQCAADAAGVELALHPEAEAAIRSRTDMEITPQRLKMGEFPRGSRIIPNPYNRIPGFSLEDHHFVPGFQVMAWPMVEWVLDHRYGHLFHLTPEAEASIIVYDLPESTVTPLMIEVEQRYRGLKSFSLPSMGEAGVRRHIELGVRGAPEEVTPGIEQMKLGVVALGGRWEEKRQ